MIPVARPKPPKDFRTRCTERGAAWLKAHPLDAKGDGKEPRDYWSAFEPEFERERANVTLDALGLRDGTVATRYRAQYLHEYHYAVAHGLDAAKALGVLDAKAPQLAAYVRATP